MRTDDDAGLARLRAGIAGLGSACVAFSGGVDSSLLLWAAADTLGREHVVAFTAVSETYLDEELDAARRLAADLGVAHVVTRTEELRDPRFAENSRERCYHCKAHLVERMRAVATERGCAALLDGANRDDLGDHRPGMRAAEEAGVRHPLLEAGLGKADVRRLARLAGLATWDAPQQACLASRIPYGQPITVEKLRAVAAAEAALRSLGFRQCRVRHHGDVARVEVEQAELERAFAARADIARAVHGAGFTYAALDLDGFRSGSMNEAAEPPAATGAPDPR